MLPMVQSPIGSGSWMPPMVAGYCAIIPPDSSYAATVRLDFDTTTRATLGAGGRCTLGTTICSPADARFLPGFSAASSLGAMWNFSPSASCADCQPSDFICACS